MNEPHRIEIEQLRLSHSLALSSLIAAYAQALRARGARQPDQLYAEQLLQDRSAHPSAPSSMACWSASSCSMTCPSMSGLRCGQADHIYVHHDHRGKGIAKALVDVLADQAPARGWSKLMLNAPRFPETGRKVFEIGRGTRRLALLRCLRLRPVGGATTVEFETRMIVATGQPACGVLALWRNLIDFCAIRRLLVLTFPPASTRTSAFAHANGFWPLGQVLDFGHVHFLPPAVLPQAWRWFGMANDSIRAKRPLSPHLTIHKPIPDHGEVDLPPHHRHGAVFWHGRRWPGG